MILLVLSTIASLYMWVHRYWFPDTVRVTNGIAILNYRWHGVNSHYLIPLSDTTSEWKGRVLYLDDHIVDPTLPPYPSDRYHCNGKTASSLEELAETLVSSDDELTLDEAN
jgi:hypothetical protein